MTQLRIPSTMKVGSPPSDQRQDHTHGIAWGAWPWVGLVVVSMLLLDVVDLVWLGLIVPGAALVLVVLQRHRPPSGVRWVGGAIDRQDLFVVSALYLAVVGLFRLAFDGSAPTASPACSSPSPRGCSSAPRDPSSTRSGIAAARCTISASEATSFGPLPSSLSGWQVSSSP